MCGIVGVYSKDKPVDPPALIEATKLLKHRGPDAQRWWVSQKQHVGLGHARLSIIDLQSGDQPLSSQDEQIWAVVNGEFYGYKQIRKTLEREGFKFKTQSDSEILIALYQKYGMDCLSHLRGEFAFILWDATKQSLFAARDRFGIKPLFYTIHDGRLIVASEAKAILAFNVPAKWNANAVFLMEHSMLASDTTYFDGVFAIKPGHFILKHGEAFQQVQYWDADFAEQDELAAVEDEAQLIELFTEKLEESIKVRLEADVPVGCYLSGGIDSCAILSLAAKHVSNIKSFTIAFDDERFDESPFAKKMAERVGADYSEVVLSRREMAEHFVDSIWYLEQLVVNPHGVAKYLLSKHVHENDYKVVLTGEGADDTLGGYQFFKEDMLYHESGGRSREEVQRVIDEYNKVQVAAGFTSRVGEGVNLPEVEAAFGFVPGVICNGALRSNYFSRLRKATFDRDCAGKNAFLDILSGLDMGKINGRGAVNKSMYLFSKTILPNFILTVLSDRMEMAHSVEGRQAFLDHHLFELSRKLPTAMKIKGLTEKYILKEAVKDKVLPEVYQRTKQPFFAPPATDMSDPTLFHMMMDTFNSKTLKTLPFYDQRQVLAFVDDVVKKKGRELVVADSVLIQIFSACIMQDLYGLSD